MALNFLLEKNKPKDDNIRHYQQGIKKELKKMLNVRKDVFSKKWYKDRIRKSFDDYHTEKISNNRHVTAEGYL